ncbi:hypothetical protein B0H13DRAFT_2003448 [Mycena leptocephala]|nr:hypothetical protein B0H13DRAFT_2003448 [Mycena leptocephala]
MSRASRFTSLSPHESFFTDGEGAVEDEDREVLGSKGRLLSYREQEALGMWAATMKVMAGTQMLLPTMPTFVPVVLPQPRSLHHIHPYPLSTYSSAPPGSPHRPPRPHRTTAALPGLLQEASAACTRMMRIAQALERRSNAERRLARGKRPRPPPASVVRAAPTSTAPAVGDDSPCRAATARPPRPLVPCTLELVGLLVDVPPPAPSPSSPFADNLLSSPSSQPRTYVDASTDSTPVPTSRDVAVDAPLPRSFSDAAVETSEAPDDYNTTYGVIRDPFARSLARLIPREFERERKLTRAIYLDDWYRWAEWIDSNLPPVQRVYLNALAEIFRPWCDPQLGVSMELYLNPVYNLFTHWWSGWNAIPFPGRPPERNPRFRYNYLSDPELRGEVPLVGRGVVVQHASGF